MLDQRRRRWANINTTLYKRLVFAGLGHICTCIQAKQDGEMNQMTLPCRQSIRNSSPGGVRVITQPLGHVVFN